MKASSLRAAALVPAIAIGAGAPVILLHGYTGTLDRRDRSRAAGCAARVVALI